MGTEPSFNHEQLLTLARKIEAAARDTDADRLAKLNFRLFEALVEHLGDEAPALLALPPGEARLLRRGQDRLVDTVVDLALSAQTATSSRCQCTQLAETLIALLTLQADDERLHLLAVGVAA